MRWNQAKKNPADEGWFWGWVKIRPDKNELCLVEPVREADYLEEKYRDFRVWPYTTIHKRYSWLRQGYQITPLTTAELIAYDLPEPALPGTATKNPRKGRRTPPLKAEWSWVWVRFSKGNRLRGEQEGENTHLGVMLSNDTDRTHAYVVVLKSTGGQHEAVVSPTRVTRLTAAELIAHDLGDPVLAPVRGMLRIQNPPSGNRLFKKNPEDRMNTKIAGPRRQVSSPEERKLYKELERLVRKHKIAQNELKSYWEMLDGSRRDEFVKGIVALLMSPPPDPITGVPPPVPTTEHHRLAMARRYAAEEAKRIGKADLTSRFKQKDTVESDDGKKTQIIDVLEARPADTRSATSEAIDALREKYEEASPLYVLVYDLHHGKHVMQDQPRRLRGAQPLRELRNYHSKALGESCPTCRAISRYVQVTGLSGDRVAQIVGMLLLELRQFESS